jgi:hypothetical protein
MAENPPGKTHQTTTDAVKISGRRSLLRAAVWGGGLAGLGGLAGFAANRLTRGTPSGTRAKRVLGPEFTYDVGRFQKSDPALLRYEESGRFAVDLPRPSHLALAADGSVWVSGATGISRYSEDGTKQATIATAAPVTSIALRPDGRILAGQTARITTFSSDGAELAVWSDFSETMLPTSMVVAGEWVIVADAGNRVLLKLDDQGKTHSLIGSRDDERGIGGFSVPSPYFCVRMAPDGLLRVSNPGKHRIEAYTLDGHLEVVWGRASFEVDGFCGCCNPVSFDVFPDGSFVTCEKGLPRVKLYDSEGAFSGLVAGPEAFPEYLKAADAGSPDLLGAGIYTTTDSRRRVFILDATGGTVRIMQPKPTSGP